MLKKKGMKEEENRKVRGDGERKSLLNKVEKRQGGRESNLNLEG